MEFEESRIRFQFKNGWLEVVKYDEEKDYKKLTESLPGTKGVDFLASQKDALYFIEVKNYRSHRIESKPKIEVLDIQVAQKVRDTLAGIIGGARNSTNKKESWEHFLKYLAKAKNTIHIMLWMEEDYTQSLKRRKSAASILNSSLKSQLSWLTGKVIVIDKANNPLEDSLTAEFLPE